MASNNSKPTSAPTFKVTNGKLVIEMQYDPKASYPMSSSGKNQMVATTRGFVTFEGLRIGLNVIK